MHRRETGMSMLETIRAKREEIYAIARRHKAEKLWVFGSCARGEETPGSDVDFVAKFQPNTSLLSHACLEDELSRIFGCGVDVVSYNALVAGSRFAREFEQEGVPI